MRDAAPIQRSRVRGSRGLVGAARLRLRSRAMLFAGFVALFWQAGLIGAGAETLNGALARAYEGIPI